MKYIFIILFIIGFLFINAAHIPAWFLSGEKPTHPGWKIYGTIGVIIWILLLILGNTIL